MALSAEAGRTKSTNAVPFKRPVPLSFTSLHNRTRPSLKSMRRVAGLQHGAPVSRSCLVTHPGRGQPGGLCRECPQASDGVLFDTSGAAGRCAGFAAATRAPQHPFGSTCYNIILCLLLHPSKLKSQDVTQPLLSRQTLPEHSAAA